MTEYRLVDTEEYRSSGPVMKKLYDGELSGARVLHLSPGQAVPTHPHDRFEVVLVPQKGWATLTLSAGQTVLLSPGTVYRDPEGSSFGIRNDSGENFQMLVVLIHKSEQPA